MLCCVKPRLSEKFAEILAPLAFEVLAHKEYLWLNKGMSGGSNARERFGYQIVYTVTSSSTPSLENIGFFNLSRLTSNFRFFGGNPVFSQIDVT